ncbi:YegP family protein [Macrococcoides caseolyticum]|uniref:YegP family protein n=1 Tax=Macrococcoides caseolyticum TaxID=69966 RepID=UPI000C32911B|nr:YegP family protein [Macrococcus caseolyticus]PKE16421.1 DUF1508 domain-containing protein [Macrococcus caseolyticus]
MTFFIRQASNGQYYFVIKSDNHEIVATSELYPYKSTAKSTIESIKNNIDKSSLVIDITE